MASVLNYSSRCLLSNVRSAAIPLVSCNFSPNVKHSVKPKPLPESQVTLSRDYSKKFRGIDGCRRALKDIPEPVDPKCPLPCETKTIKPKGILYKIKLKIIQGGTNFGTPFRFLKGKKKVEKVVEVDVPEQEEELPVPQSKFAPIPDSRPGVQVSVLGADTAVGQYVSLMLKQCPQIRKLRLFASRAQDCKIPPGNITNPCRNMFNVVQDLQHIDTNCVVQAYSCSCNGDLELCLQNSDVVLMLENGYANVNMSLEKRFECQAPLVRQYADAISHECPRAMIIVCVSPVDCMVPLVAETLKETGWYDKRKLIGSMAVPEMRASTLAARALCLEPRYTRVPCVGGTEGEALVPLFSKAVNQFDFARHNAEMMTETVRTAPFAVARNESCCMRNADLSEAHALAGLVKNVSHALLCQDIPKISAFVETDSSQVISPARYLAVDVMVNRHGICKKFDFPYMSELEKDLMDLMWDPLLFRVNFAKNWFHRTHAEYNADMKCLKNFNLPGRHDQVDSCSCHLVY